MYIISIAYKCQQLEYNNIQQIFPSLFPSIRTISYPEHNRKHTYNVAERAETSFGERTFGHVTVNNFFMQRRARGAAFKPQIAARTQTVRSHN